MSTIEYPFHSSFNYVSDKELHLRVYENYQNAETKCFKRLILREYSELLAKTLGKKLEKLGLPVQVIGNALVSPWNEIVVDPLSGSIGGITIYYRHQQGRSSTSCWEYTEKDILRILQQGFVEISSKNKNVKFVVDMLNIDDAKAIVSYYNFGKTGKNSYGDKIPLEMGRDFIRGKISLDEIADFLNV